MRTIVYGIMIGMFTLVIVANLLKMGAALSKNEKIGSWIAALLINLVFTAGTVVLYYTPEGGGS